MPSVTASAVCSGQNGCPAGSTYIQLRQVRLDLNDETDPTISVQPAGPLTSGSNVDRLRSLTYTAADQGGGVYRQRLVVDGAVALNQVVNDNGGKCALPFRDPVPCRTASVNGTVDFDTATLADGSHDLRLDVSDATDTNKVQTAVWRILVDNVPPEVGKVGMTGVAREGEKLTCAGTVTGQSASTSYTWLRANADGSGQAVITGAQAASYELTGADIGRKVLCRVTGTDHGGSATADSSITSGPFADGAVVVGYCTGRPTGAQDECGDFDGDSVINRLDPDDDNDGVPDTSDPAPFDPKIPAPATTPSTDPTPTGSTGSTGATGAAGAAGATGAAGQPGGTSSSSQTITSTTTTSGNGGGSGTSAQSLLTLVATDLNTVIGLRNPVTEAIANGAPASGDALLAARLVMGSGASLRASTRMVAPFAQGLKVRGTLQTALSRPIVGAKVYLVQRATAGDARWQLGKVAATAADGTFSIPVAGSGPSREIRVVYFPQGGSDVNRGSNPLSLQVRQDATFAVSKRRLHNGGRLVFSGRVLGTVPSSGVDVRVQVRLNRSWYTFQKLTTTRSKGGRFRASHRFTETTTATTYRFRILVLPRNRRQYTTGFSRHIDVRVLP